MAPKKPVRSRSGGHSGISQKSIENFKSQATKKIISSCESVANTTAENIAKAFALGVKSRLLQGGYEQAADFYSQRLVSNLAKTITYDKKHRTRFDKDIEEDVEENVYTVRIPVDKHGLMLYLEYGTGLVGARSSDGYAEKHGWHYAVNKKKYRRVEDYNPYKGFFHENHFNTNWGEDYLTPFTYPLGGKLGFVYNPSKTSFITKDDIYPVPFISRKIYHYKDKKLRRTKSYVRKNGVKVKGYLSILKNKNYGKTKVYKFDYTNKYRLVWSEGIRPIRFIYETKLRLKNLLKNINMFSGYYELSRKGKKPFTAYLGYKVLSPNAVRLLDSLSNKEWSKTGGKV